MKSMLLILMGVSGSGKTTIGKRLAEELHGQFVDADQFHSLESIQKMSQGIPLTDGDRLPWLNALHDFIQKQLNTKRDTVLACSALKSSYRQILQAEDQSIQWVYLKGTTDLLQQRIQARQGHYMSPQLLTSQLESLEEPEGAIVIDIAQSPEAIIQDIKAQIIEEDSCSPRIG
jgi:gluconokinase